MELQDKYTTAVLIAADLSGKEAKKIEISSEAYAMGEMIQKLITKIEQARLSCLM